MTSTPVSPFADLRRALDQVNGAWSAIDQEDGQSVRVDPGRWTRTGVPEIVHADAKSTDDVVLALSRLVRVQGRALASRVRPDDLATICAALEPELTIEVHVIARCLVAATPGVERLTSGGAVGILSAGSSDVPVASEAALIAAEMGVKVLEAWDVGVAGLHRLVEPLERFAIERVDAIIVAAGMDGALPSVVAGLVDVPVIGLPTSIGYGLGGAGVGALTTMLQSCAPGLVVVNIDNGIGAGATAALIANRVAKSRQRERVDASREGLDSLSR